MKEVSMSYMCIKLMLDAETININFLEKLIFGVDEDDINCCFYVNQGYPYG